MNMTIYLQIGKNKMIEIKELLNITNSLRIKYNRGFTLDGKLVGDIGEVLASEYYGIKLYPENNKLYDGEEIATGKKIQIKSTFKGNCYIKANHIPDYFLAIHILENGDIEEMYNGTGQFIIDNYILERGLKPSNNEFGLSRRKLEELNTSEENIDKIKRIK